MTPNVLVSNSSRVVAIGVASNAPTTPIPRVVDEHVDWPARLERGGDAVGFRHVERHHAKPFRCGQHMCPWISHGGDHVPALRMEVARRFKAIARRAT